MAQNNSSHTNPERLHATNNREPIPAYIISQRTYFFAQRVRSPNNIARIS